MSSKHRNLPDRTSSTSAPTDATHAIVRVAMAAVRARPGVREEQVSQEPLGGVVEILAREGDEWLRVRGEDAYEGWMSTGALQSCGAETARRWLRGEDDEPLIVLDARFEPGDADEGVPLQLPWGARLVGDDDAARLPDGRRGRLLDGDWVAQSERAGRYPARPRAIVATASTWSGVPYLWGGRSRWGADCSGFVQAVYRLHGVALPRDGDQQAERGLAVRAEHSEARAGDLLFFKGSATDRITHVAIGLGGSEILHAAQPNGAVARDDLAGGGWAARSLAKRLVAVRRVLGIEP